MRGTSWSRFGVEAAFLILVAVGAGILGLDRREIVALMALAYVAVVGVEWAASRRARRVAAHGEAAAPPAPTAVPAVESGGRRSERSKRRRAARHVRVLAEDGRPPAEPAVSAGDGTPPPLPEPLPPALEPPSGELVGAAADADAETEDVGEQEATVSDAPAEHEAEEAGPDDLGAREPLEADAGAAEAIDVAPPEPEPEPEREAEPEPQRAAEPVDDVPREWNLWELERAVRHAGGEDAARHEERAFLLVYLREFAGPDGTLPVDFDALVRDSFGDVIGVAPR